MYSSRFLQLCNILNYYENSVLIDVYRAAIQYQLRIKSVCINVLIYFLCIMDGH